MSGKAFLRSLAIAGLLAAGVPALTSTPVAHAADVNKVNPAASDTQPSANATTACGLQRSEGTYHGSNAARDLQRAIPDPLKVVNYPCPFPSDVRGIRIDPGTVSLIAGGQLVRRIPLDATRSQVRLEQIVAAIGDPTWISMPTPGTVVLNAALIQESGTDLLVAAPSVRTIRMIAKPNMSISGSHAKATFSGVTVTSWDPATNAPQSKPVSGRPFVLYENASELDASLSKFTYLGSDLTSSYGVSWRVGGSHGTVTNCIFEHNFFGVYTYDAANVLFENSIFRFNDFYGLDPHDSSSHLTIRNNDVYGNGDHGIVFSRYVHDSLVEKNRVHDNKVNGIMMDFHSDHNRIINNVVTGNSQGIVMSGSANVEVSGNTVTGNQVGVRASHQGADADNIHNNIISGGDVGIQLYGGATSAKVASNSIHGTAKSGVIVDAPRTSLSGNTISSTTTGMSVQTVADLSGDNVTAGKIGVQVAEQGFATLTNERIHSPKTVSAAPGSYVRVDGIEVSGADSHGVSGLDKVGLGLLGFALLSQVIHMTRRRALLRVTAAALAGSDETSGPPVTRGLARLVLRGAKPKTPVQPAKRSRIGDTERPPASRRFRPDIEGLRAIAVVSVILSHFSLGVPGGYIGVDVFFVISGFLITGQLLSEARRSGRFSFAGFYARRIRRILPAATLVTVSTMAMSLAWVSPLRFAGIAKDGLAAAFFGVNWRLAAQATDYFHASAPASPFQHYWSLSVEEQFYVAWPLLLAGVMFIVRKTRWRRASMAAVLVIAIGLSLWASVQVTSVSGPYAYFGTHTRVWELALGALIAVGSAELARLPRAIATVAAWLGLAAIVSACFLYTSDTTYPGIAATLPVIGAGLIIAGGCGRELRGGPERLLRMWPMQWTGRLSYSLYLWHWPLFVLAPYMLGHDPSVSERLMFVLIAAVLSLLTYAFVEEPFRHRQLLVIRPRRAMMVAGGLIATSTAVALVLPLFVVLPGANQPTTTPVLAAAVKVADNSGSANTSTQLGALLTTAAAQKSLPPDVTPTVSDAAHDFPDTNGCEVPFAATVPKLPCDEFGDVNGNKQVVLIGDSHAGMWLTAVDAVASENHWRLSVYTKAGCAVGDYRDLVLPQLGRPYTECNAWRTAIVNQISRVKPALVVIASEARPIAAQEDAGLTKVVTELRRSAGHVAFLADTPSPRPVGDIPDCLARHTGDISACAIPRAAALGQPGRDAEIQAARRGGATVVDPASWFCTATQCPAVIQNVIVYEDDSHITATYGRLRAPQLSSALTAAMA